MFKRMLLAIMLCSSSACTFAAACYGKRMMAPFSPERVRAVMALLDLMGVNSEIDETAAFTKAHFLQLASNLGNMLSLKGTLVSTTHITQYGLSTSPKKELTPDMSEACVFLMSLAQQTDFKDVRMSKDLFASYIVQLKSALKASSFALSGTYIFDGTSCIFRKI